MWFIYIRNFEAWIFFLKNHFWVVELLYYVTLPLGELQLVFTLSIFIFKCTISYVVYTTDFLK